MKRYMLDTNTVSHLIKEHPTVVRRVLAAPMAALCISAITKAELMFGLAKRPQAKRLHKAVHELLRRVDVLAWDGDIAELYGAVRADMAHQGKTLSPLDLLITTHALCVGAVLVTSDQAFAQLSHLHVEDWSRE